MKVPRRVTVLERLQQITRPRAPAVTSPIAPSTTITTGTGELEFSGASIEAQGNVTHGLGDTPTFATPIFEDAGYVPGAAALGETTFQARTQKRDGTIPPKGTKAKFRWIAVL